MLEQPQDAHRATFHPRSPWGVVPTWGSTDGAGEVWEAVWDGAGWDGDGAGEGWEAAGPEDPEGWDPAEIGRAHV